MPSLRLGKRAHSVRVACSGNEQTPWPDSATELYRPSNRRVRVVMTAYYYSSEDGMIYYYYCYCEDKMLFTGIGTGFML